MDPIRETHGESGHDDERGRRHFNWLLAALTLAWAAVTFVPPLLARELSFEVLGLPFPLWMAAQGAPIVYVILVWVCERRASRLEGRQGAERARAD